MIDGYSVPSCLQAVAKDGDTSSADRVTLALRCLAPTIGSGDALRAWLDASAAAGRHGMDANGEFAAGQAAGAAATDNQDDAAALEAAIQEAGGAAALAAANSDSGSRSGSGSSADGGVDGDSAGGHDLEAQEVRMSAGTFATFTCSVPINDA